MRREIRYPIQSSPTHKSSSSLRFEDAHTDLIRLRFDSKRRIANVFIVLERSSKTRDYEAMCRTCECLGVQNVWILEHPPPRKLEECESAAERSLLEETFTLPRAGFGIFKKARKFLTVRYFRSAGDFVDACKEEGLEIWCTHGLRRDEYNFDFAEAYGVSASIWGGSDNDGDGSPIVSVQDLTAADLPERVAVVFCMDANGFAREVASAATTHVRYRTSPAMAASVSLNPTVTGALVTNRLADLKRRRVRSGDPTGAGGPLAAASAVVRGILRALGLGNEPKPSVSAAGGRSTVRGDLGRAAKRKLRERWYNALARNEMKRLEYMEFVDRPPKPFGDLRPPEVFRKPRIDPEIAKRIKVREQQAGFTLSEDPAGCDGN